MDARYVVHADFIVLLEKMLGWSAWAPLHTH